MQKIEFVRSRDFSARDLFEFGSGNSTLFCSARCGSVRAVEDDPEWLEKVENDHQSRGPSERFPATGAGSRRLCCRGWSRRCRYGVIVIDGRFFYDCVTPALVNLPTDGFIILDNAKWVPRTAALWRDAGLRQIPVWGFCPFNGYRITTAIFFTRNTVLPAVGDDSLAIPVGGLDCRRGFASRRSPSLG